MTIGLTCERCGREFALSPEQEANVEERARAGVGFAAIDCPYCPGQAACDPTTVVSGKAQSDAPASEVFKCPVARCSGDVAFVDGDEDPFWGCGECGSVWYDKNNFFRDIDGIVAKYPYRRRCYAKLRSGWRPANRAPDPKGYRDHVVAEVPEKQRKSYVRG